MYSYYPMGCRVVHPSVHMCLHTHTFNGPLSGTTQLSRYQKGKTNLDFMGARDSEWQWHQLGHMQIYTLLQTNNHASTPPLSFLQAGCPSCHPTSSIKALKACMCLHTYMHFLTGLSSTSSYYCICVSDMFICLQCFDTVGWTAGRASGLKKN